MVAGDLASMHWAATYGMLYRRTQLVDSTLSLRGLQMPFDASGALILHLLSIRKVSKALGLSKHCPLRLASQPTLSIPGLLLQILQYRLPACVLLIPPRQSGADKLLVQVAAIRQDDLGHRPFVAVDVADLHRHHLSESQIPGELLCPRPEWLLHSGQSIPHSRMCSAAPLCITRMVSPSLTATTLPV